MIKNQISSIPIKKNIHNYYLFIFCMLLFISCTNKKDKKTTSTDIEKDTSASSENKKSIFTEKIELAHSKKTFLGFDAIKFNIEIIFGGNSILKGEMTFSTDSRLGIIVLENGGKIFIDKDKAYCTQDISEMKRKRFHAYTWSYFLLLPYKLNDPGTKWSNAKLNYQPKDLEYKKLYFDAGVGDTPKDWYIIFADKQTNLIDYVSYIVTSGKSLDKAEQDPHAIKYTEYKKIQGVQIAHHWSYKEWNDKNGLGKELGKGIITDVQLVNNFSEKFVIPKDVIEIVKE